MPDSPGKGAKEKFRPPTTKFGQRAKMLAPTMTRLGTIVSPANGRFSPSRAWFELQHRVKFSPPSSMSPAPHTRVYGAIRCTYQSAVHARTREIKVLSTCPKLRALCGRDTTLTHGATSKEPKAEKILARSAPEDNQTSPRPRRRGMRYPLTGLARPQRILLHPRARGARHLRRGPKFALENRGGLAE